MSAVERVLSTMVLEAPQVDDLVFHLRPFVQLYQNLRHQPAQVSVGVSKQIV